MERTLGRGPGSDTGEFQVTGGVPSEAEWLQECRMSRKGSEGIGVWPEWVSRGWGSVQKSMEVHSRSREHWKLSQVQAPVTNVWEAEVRLQSQSPMGVRWKGSRGGGILMV